MKCPLCGGDLDDFGDSHIANNPFCNFWTRGPWSEWDE